MSMVKKHSVYYFNSMSTFFTKVSFNLIIIIHFIELMLIYCIKSYNLLNRHFTSVIIIFMHKHDYKISVRLSNMVLPNNCF